MTALAGSTHGMTETAHQLTALEISNLAKFDQICRSYEARSRASTRTRGFPPLSDNAKIYRNAIRTAIEGRDDERKNLFCIKLHAENDGLWNKLKNHNFCPALEAPQEPNPMEHVVNQIAAAERKQRLGVPSQRRARNVATQRMESKTSETVVEPGHRAQYGEYGDYYYGDMDSLLDGDIVPGYNGDLVYYGTRQNNYKHTSYGNIFGNEMFLGVSLALNLILMMGLICLLCFAVVLLCHLYGGISMERKRKNKNGMIPIPMDDGSSDV